MLSVVSAITCIIIAQPVLSREYDTYNQPPNEHHNEFQRAMGSVIDKITERHLLNINPNTLEPAEIEAMLDAHNTYRSQTALGNAPAYSEPVKGLINQPSATNMNKLAWDSALAKVARDYASGCYIEHNDNAATDMLKPTVAPLATFTYPSSAPTSGQLSVGENIYYSSMSNPTFYGLYGIHNSVLTFYNESYHWYVMFISLCVFCFFGYIY